MPHFSTPSSSSSSSSGPEFPGAELISGRLRLRPWTSDEIAAVLGGPRPAHWAADFPAEGDREIAGFLAGLTGPGALFGQWQLTERDGGLIVGAAGLFWPPREGAVEFGYGVVPSRRGRGYATEAARAIAEFALGAPGVHTVYARVEPGNPASVRVLEKAGLRRRPDPGETLTFALTADELSAD